MRSCVGGLSVQRVQILTLPEPWSSGRVTQSAASAGVAMMTARRATVEARTRLSLIWNMVFVSFGSGVSVRKSPTSA